SGMDVVRPPYAQDRRAALSIRSALLRRLTTFVVIEISALSRSRLSHRASGQLHHFQQHRFAGIDQLVERDSSGTLCLRSAVAGEQRHMDERRELRAVVAVRSLDRA